MSEPLDSMSIEKTNGQGIAYAASCARPPVRDARRAVTVLSNPTKSAGLEWHTTCIYLSRWRAVSSVATSEVAMSYLFGSICVCALAMQSPSATVPKW